MKLTIIVISILFGLTAQAQKPGETFTYRIDIARSGDIDSGQGVQFETRHIDVKYIGESTGFGSKKVMFTFADRERPNQQGKFEFDYNRWAQAKGTWAYATAHPGQCLQLGGNFLQAGAQLPNEPLDLCRFRTSKESIAITYSVVNLGTPMQYELEEKGAMNAPQINAFAPSSFIPAEMVQALNLRTNAQGKFWYRAIMVQHTGGSSRP